MTAGDFLEGAWSHLPREERHPASGKPIPFDRSLWAQLKLGYALRRVPQAAYGYAAGIESRAPRPGDLVLARVGSLGQHTSLECASGRRVPLQVGDLLIGVYGNHYSTFEYEGLVPHTSRVCQLLDPAGVCGLVLSKHIAAQSPSELSVLGFVHDPSGQPLSLSAYSLPQSPIAVPAADSERTLPRLILVAGSAVRSGKTTAAAGLIHGLAREGYKVAAAKVNGSVAGLDRWSFHDQGAARVLDFFDCGLPGTYLCSPSELLAVYRTIYHALCASQPDFLVLELADGLAQRETRLLLEHPEVRDSSFGVLFAALDSLGAEAGLRWLGGHGYTLLGLSGLVAASPLAAQEAEEFTGARCYSREELLYGGLNPELTSLPAALTRQAGGLPLS